MFALFPPWKGAVMQGSCARDVVVMQWVSELCIFLPRITAKVVPAFLLCTDHQLVCAPGLPSTQNIFESTSTVLTTNDHHDNFPHFPSTTLGTPVTSRQDG